MELMNVKSEAALGGILGKQRAEIGKTLEAIASSINSDKTTLSRFENGERSIPDDLCWDLANAYEIDPFQLKFVTRFLRHKKPDRRNRRDRNRGLKGDSLSPVEEFKKIGDSLIGSFQNGQISVAEADEVLDDWENIFRMLTKPFTSPTKGVTNVQMHAPKGVSTRKRPTPT